MHTESVSELLNTAVEVYWNRILTIEHPQPLRAGQPWRHGDTLGSYRAVVDGQPNSQTFESATHPGAFESSVTFRSGKTRRVNFGRSVCLHADHRKRVHGRTFGGGTLPHN